MILSKKSVSSFEIAQEEYFRKFCLARSLPVRGNNRKIIGNHGQ